MEAALSSPINRVELVPHQRYNRWPRSGELYGFEVAEIGWLVCRVISDCPSELPNEKGDKKSGILMVYIYKHIYNEASVDSEFIDKKNLLLPPILLTHRLWKDGFMVPVGQVLDTRDSLLKKHCFWHMAHRKFHDEYGKVLKKVVRPCGFSGVFLYDGLCKWLGKSLKDGFDQDSHPLS